MSVSLILRCPKRRRWVGRRGTGPQYLWQGGPSLGGSDFWVPIERGLPGGGWSDWRRWGASHNDACGVSLGGVWDGEGEIICCYFLLMSDGRVQVAVFTAVLDRVSRKRCRGCWGILARVVASWVGGAGEVLLLKPIAVVGKLYEQGLHEPSLPRPEGKKMWTRMEGWCAHVI